MHADRIAERATIEEKFSGGAVQASAFGNRGWK
jgi:hypothetical protein